MARGRFSVLEGFKIVGSGIVLHVGVAVRADAEGGAVS